MGLRASSRTAFSLLELLVVISIVLFLAAVFFPVIPHRHGQGKAKQSACASNLKQSALAALSYAEDHDGTLPPV